MDEKGRGSEFDKPQDVLFRPLARTCGVTACDARSVPICRCRSLISQTVFILLPIKTFVAGRIEQDGTPDAVFLPDLGIRAKPATIYVGF
jgi:hypothetical protein